MDRTAHSLARRLVMLIKIATFCWIGFWRRQILVSHQILQGTRLTIGSDDWSQPPAYPIYWLQATIVRLHTTHNNLNGLRPVCGSPLKQGPTDSKLAFTSLLARLETIYSFSSSFRRDKLRATQRTSGNIIRQREDIRRKSFPSG